jgi:transcriptional regulator with XRE-family HTH domain
MRTNKDIFLELPFVSTEQTNTLEKNRQRIKNRAWLRESQKIALKVLTRLDELGWTQKILAEKMGVSPQQINKITSGKINLTIDTQVKLQQILDIPVLATYYENKTGGTINEPVSLFNATDYLDYTVPESANLHGANSSIEISMVKIEYNRASDDYTHYSLTA